MQVMALNQKKLGNSRVVKTEKKPKTQTFLLIINVGVDRSNFKQFALEGC